VNGILNVKQAGKNGGLGSSWHGPLRDRCPRPGPNQPRIILKRSMKALYGPMDTFKEVRMFSTDVLG
jgi:hypothetical protein